MSTATAIQADMVWLCIVDYAVAPLNPSLASRALQVQQALANGAYAYPDLSRNGFYDVKLPDGWAYIHIRDDNRTVYLIADSPTV